STSPRKLQRLGLGEAVEVDHFTVLETIAGKPPKRRAEAALRGFPVDGHHEGLATAATDHGLADGVNLECVFLLARHRRRQRLAGQLDHAALGRFQAVDLQRVARRLADLYLETAAQVAALDLAQGESRPRGCGRPVATK